MKIFKKAIHLTSTDLEETYIIRNISNNFETIRSIYDEGKFDFESYTIKVQKDDVYSCKSIIKSIHEGGEANDFAIFKLKRAVINKTPLNTA